MDYNDPLFWGTQLFLRRVYQLYLAQNSPRKSFHTSGWPTIQTIFWKILKHSIFWWRLKKKRFWQRSDLITVLNFKKNLQRKKNTFHIIPTSISDSSAVSFSIFRIFFNAVCRRFFPQVCHLLTSNGCRWMKWNPEEARLETQWTRSEPTIPLGSHSPNRFTKKNISYQTYPLKNSRIPPFERNIIFNSFFVEKGCVSDCSREKKMSLAFFHCKNHILKWPKWLSFWGISTFVGGSFRLNHCGFKHSTSGFLEILASVGGKTWEKIMQFDHKTPGTPPNIWRTS